MLIGSGALYSRKMATAWIVWAVLLLIVYWVWFAYSQLKYHGYIEFAGQKGCYFCDHAEASQAVGTSGAAGSALVIASIVIASVFRPKCDKWHRERAAMRSSGYLFDNVPAGGQQVSNVTSVYVYYVRWLEYTTLISLSGISRRPTVAPIPPATAATTATGVGPTAVSATTAILAAATAIPSAAALPTAATTVATAVLPDAEPAGPLRQLSAGPHGQQILTDPTKFHLTYKCCDRRHPSSHIVGCICTTISGTIN